MEVIRGIENVTPELGGATLTVGSFDGVHSGHLSLLSTLTKRAKERGEKSVVVSFTPHPRVALGRTEGFGLLTSDEEKIELLSQTGVDTLLLLDFNKQFSMISAEEFIVQYLMERVGMKELVVGYNHHLGHNSGDCQSILALSQKHNFSLTLTQEYSLEGEQISSTTIRQAVKEGDIDRANKLLSHPYLLIGNSDDRGAVIPEEPLKIIPPHDLYLVDINGRREIVKVNSKGKLWCKPADPKVAIKFILRYEH